MPINTVEAESKTIPNEVNNLHIAVVDDEPVICTQIRTLIQKEYTDCEVDTYFSGREFLAAGKRFELVFLDIQMEEMNGMETARAFREQQPEAVLIFVTGVKEYVFEAFDVAAFHYLLKPLNETKFKEVLSQGIKEAVRCRREGQERLFIRARNQTIDQKDILYIESRGKKVDIHTLKETFTVYGSMNGLEARLSDRFYRCHRGYLVNMAYITEYSADTITLTGGAVVYLTRKKHGEFVKAYMWYLQNGGISCV